MSLNYNNIRNVFSFNFAQLRGLYATCSFILICLFGCSQANKIVLNDIEKMPNIKITFDSFTNVSYGKSRSLPGWLTTRTVIENTLKSWFSNFQLGQIVTDGTPTDLEVFLTNLPGTEDSNLSIVYLGSIQDAKANWEFVGGNFQNFHALLSRTKISANPNRIIIFDTCHAQAICSTNDQNNFLGNLTLLASSLNEKTYQFNPSALKPIDIKKHYQWAWQWGETYLPQGWSEHISFLGLVWLDTAAQRQIPPGDIMQWKQFFDECTSNAETIQNTIGRRWGSTIKTCQ